MDILRLTMASLDLMIDFVNLVVTMSAVSGLISQMQEKANLSTPPRREQRFEESKSGSMSMRRSVRYTVVHLKQKTKPLIPSSQTRLEHR